MKDERSLKERLFKVFIIMQADNKICFENQLIHQSFEFSRLIKSTVSDIHLYTQRKSV